MTGAYGMSESAVKSWQDPNKTAFERIQTFLATSMAAAPPEDGKMSPTPARLDIHIATLTSLTLLSATSALNPPSATATFTFTVPPSLCGASDILHGGFVAFILDACTGMLMVPVARPGFWEFGGPSRTMNVVYVRSAKVGEQCRVECEVVGEVGRGFALLRGVIKSQETDKVLYTGEHQMVSIQPRPAPAEGGGRL